MGLFKKKAKNKKTAIPRNCKLFGILRGIDEQEIWKAREMAGFEHTLKIEPKAEKVELVEFKKLQK